MSPRRAMHVTTQALRISPCSILSLMLPTSPTGMARTVFMEQRSKFGPTIDLQSSGPAPSAASLAAALASSGEFALAFRCGRTYGLRLAQGAVPRPRAGDTLKSALVTGGSKVRQHPARGLVAAACLCAHFCVCLIQDILSTLCLFCRAWA